MVNIMKPVLLLFQQNFQSSYIIWLFTFWLLISINDAKSKLPNYQSILCADIHCKEPIADGITTIRYPSPDRNLLSFKKDLNVKILGKTDDKIYYFAEVNKKRGFVPAKLIKETNVHFDETKLDKVQFDFDEYEKSLKSSISIVESGSDILDDNNNNGQINDSIVLSSSSNVDHHNQVPNDSSISQQSSATPFVYSQKVTVIDGTTINEDLLGGLNTATPSPTFVQNPVTKTATIEANFSNIIDNELDSKNVNNQNESELNKQHGSLLKQLGEPMVVVQNSTVDSTVQDDVTVSGEDSSEIVESLDAVHNSTSNVVNEEKNDSNKESTKNSTLVADENEVKVEENNDDKTVQQEMKISEPEAPINSDSVNNNQIPKTNDSDVLKAETVMNETLNENPSIQEDKKENSNNLEVDKINDKVAAESAKNDSQTTIEQQQTVEQASQLPVSNDSNQQQQQQNNDDFQQEIHRNKRDSEQQQQQQTEKVEENNLKDASNNQSSISSSNSTVDNNNNNDNVDSISSSSQTSSQPIAAADIPQNLHQQIHPPAHHHHHQQQQASPPTNVDSSKINPELNEQNVQPVNNINQQVNSNNNLPPHQPHLHPKLIQRTHVEDLKDTVNVDPLNNPPPPPPPIQQQQQQIHSTPESLPESPNSNKEYSNENHHSQSTANFHAEGSVLNSKHKPFVENRPAPIDNQNQQQQQQSVVSERLLVNPVIHSEQYQPPVNSNIFKRKLLAERVGFVSVIMEIIPDEVELFFESFNISLHAIIFTSIVAFFWCLMKVFIFFVSSSKKVRELQDTICQTQRKLYYFEAEKDKIKEEYVLCRDEYSCYKDNLHRIEKRKYQLEQENEKLKTEIVGLKKDNSSLKIQAESNPIISSKLDQISLELNRFKQENNELCSKIVELETQIDQNLTTIKQQERAARADKEEIDNLNDQLMTLNEEIEKLNETIKELEQQYNIVQSENLDLKELQNKLSEELKEMKDDLLSSEEKARNFENDYKSMESKLKTSEEKMATFMKEIENKNSEIISMQTLLNKLNKNLTKSKEHVRRRQRSATNMNGDLAIDGVNGDEDLINNTNDDDEQNIEGGGEDSICLQDVIQLQLRLTQMETEKEQFRQKFETVQKQLQDITDEIESTRKLNQQLKQNAENALQEKFKAITELEVLSKYYKEKELEYAKDIGVHRVKQEQQNEDVESLLSKLNVTEEENTIIKDQLKSIKKELEETERRYKSQLNQLEKHSHENWIAARSAERKLEETKAEASALRQALSQSVKSPPPGEFSFGGYLDDTASSVSSIPEALNTSLPVPPPPPPPFPFPSIFGSTIPPPPPPSQVLGTPLTNPAANLFDLNEQHNAAVHAAATNSSYWNSPSAVAAPVTAQAPIIQAQSSNTSNTFAFDPSKNIASTDINMTYTQINPMSHHQQQQQQPPSQPSNSNIQQQQQQPQQYNTNNSYGGYYPSGGHQQQQLQQHSFHSSQLDLTRNTYSPALSQRSTHTPLTTN
ncbi:hypothetical protein DERP_002750 [Dermatophagoides pteronyssinus]|uniref:SH3 domain-containing protein n=1 Tax=Dermatophagoides pteronyssinus TaxID=6956 RepID=A0ABQ8JVJ2_DERPT|nr:hypothetical protein DERP_002750 [Dermatophagoides pteronyssinus]